MALKDNIVYKWNVLKSTDVYSDGHSRVLQPPRKRIYRRTRSDLYQFAVLHFIAA